MVKWNIRELLGRRIAQSITRLSQRLATYICRAAATEKNPTLPGWMNGWLSPSESRCFHGVFPGRIAENYTGFPPHQGSPSLPLNGG